MKLRHTIQIDILQHLLFQPGSRFSTMKPSQMEGSKFTFHLDMLLADGLVSKTPQGDYILTTTGKEEANRYDTGADAPRTQAKVSAVFCCQNTETKEWLFYTRAKEPYFGGLGFPAGKVRLGESYTEAAERELLEETGLQGTATLLSIQHFRVYHAEDQLLLEDKLMGICLISDPKGNLQSGEEGAFQWLSLEQYAASTAQKIPESPCIADLLQRKEPQAGEQIILTHFY